MDHGYHAGYRRWGCHAMSTRPDTTIDFFGMYLAHDACMRDVRRLAKAVVQHRIHEPAVKTGWETFLRQMNRHHTTEDQALWPLVRAAVGNATDAKVLDDMENEHIRIEELLQRVEQGMLAPGAGLGSDVEELISALDSHFGHEEEAALPLIDRTVGANGWSAFGREMRKRNGLRAVTEYLPWVLDDAEPDAQRKMLALLPSPIRMTYHKVLRPRYARRRSGWS